ncbi:MAG: response regulator, partial [Bacteroidota bacterium]
VELMEGQISVESHLEQGTEFTLYLPIKSEVANKLDKVVIPSSSANESLPIKEREILEPEPASLPDSPELLIIEDNQDIITYIKTILKNSYNFQVAKNGQVGIEKALETVPDIIISDVMMPEKNGYEVCEELKQDERTSHIPIILLTARSSQDDRLEGLKYGADAYLTKPFDKQELLIRLQNLIDVRQRLQERFSQKTVTETTATIDKEAKFLQKLSAHIQTHLSDAAFGVTNLATASNISQMQLYRKLKALTGKTPSQFIRSYRLRKGLELLKAGELTVAEVAYEVGFTDPSYFSRMFHQEFKRNPSSFLSN